MVQIGTMNREDVIKVMRHRQGADSLRTFAKRIGCSAAYLSDIFLGWRDPGEKVLGFLGLTKEKTVKIVYRIQEKALKVKR